MTNRYVTWSIALLAASAAAGSAVAETTVRVATPLLAQDTDNPYQALTLPSSVSTQVMFDPMVVVGKDGQVKPWLITAWDNEESRVWRLTVRDGVSFSNGVPFTSSAIVESVAHIQTPKGRTETVGSSLSNIDRADAVSATVVEIRLKRPDPMFPWRMAIWRLPEPETWKVRRDDPAAEPAANTGPFRLTRKREAQANYAANPTAWNPPAAENFQLVHLPDQTARMQALNSDAVDIAMQMGAGDRDLLESIGGNLFERSTARVLYVSFAKEHLDEANPVHNPLVRRALNHAVNLQRISDLLLDGLARPQGQLVLEGAPGYVDEIKPYGYDPEKARQLLAEAGYGDGLEVSVRVSAAGADDMLVYQQMAEDLRQVGVTFSLLGAMPTQMTTMMFSGDFRADMFSNFGRGLDPLGDFRYRSCLGQTGNYPPYYCDEVSLDYVRTAQQTTDFEEVNRLMQNVTRREYENPPGIFLWPAIMVDGFASTVESAEGYSDYYDYIPYHTITIQE